MLQLNVFFLQIVHPKQVRCPSWGMRCLGAYWIDFELKCVENAPQTVQDHPGYPH